MVQKDQQIMADDEFPEEYILTVFPFTRDVSMTVSHARRVMFSKSNVLEF